METIRFTGVEFNNGDKSENIEVNPFAIEAVCEINERVGLRKYERSTKVMLKSGASFKVEESYASVIERLQAINKPQPKREYPPRQERRYAEKR